MLAFERMDPPERGGEDITCATKNSMMVEEVKSIPKVSLYDAVGKVGGQLVD